MAKGGKASSGFLSRGILLLIMAVLYISIAGSVLLTSDVIGTYYDNLETMSNNTNISIIFLLFMEFLPWGAAIGPFALMLGVGLRELDVI